MAKRDSSLQLAVDWVSDRMIRALLWLLMRVPYDRRVVLAGWLAAHVLAPIAGYRRRIRHNLALIMPDLPESEVRRMQRKVPENLGRTLIELYSGPEFAARAARATVTGEGLPALDAAHAEGRPVLLVTGHIGNYDAVRAALLARGFKVGGLYRPMNNRYFNDHYVEAISRIGKPLFPRGRHGLSDMVRFLRSGGMLGIVIDQYMRAGVELDFMGHPALTALSAAEMALRYDALVVPTYGIRQPNGLDFDLVFEAPIPSGTPEAMTQALNDSLAAQVRLHPDQWLWTHRRWKKPRV
ncbi:lysophospholipid acyltransferase family protein [Neotabrizicola shimadae]|uniref:Lysophospholipid acyltransferase family protein n=1 Tax=Neotabrizicola shimadae TaxID=2807096 RepID=A0A8G1ECM9_9RHOB|nr:lysophospholipid acyltransferase family protein [Neotabrizicola shimadae]QYZ70810.1 lysophospholipid acyltransferase family protein [Neotabrizicola shimadae]